jgi:hypothetical protein
MGRAGNVSDAQLGLYRSVDYGKTFIAHKNNPVFVNDYTNVYENEHMGAGFEFVKTDSADYIIYQVKNSNNEPKYSILLREKRKTF